MEEKLKSAGYRKQTSGTYKTCIECAYKERIEDEKYPYFCPKLNIYVEYEDSCNYFFDRLSPEKRQQLIKRVNDMAKFYKKMDNKEPDNSKTEQPSKSEGCYIATAVYGGYDEPEVLILRKYRDRILKKTFLGNAFIKVYYFFSPPVAEKLKNCTKINSMVRNLLNKFVESIKRKNNW